MILRGFILLYGVIAYAAFFATILYMIGFVGNLMVPKTIDSGSQTSIAEAIIVNICLMLLFAVQHTIMARPVFKARWTKVIPPAIERSTFVLVASMILALIFWQWQPIDGIVWQVDHPVMKSILIGASFLGWGIVFYSSFLIDHFDLFGLRQVFLYFRSKPYSHPPFMAISLYKLVRHPLMLGFLMAFWFAPVMTYSHLLFSSVFTIYIFWGVSIEERDLKIIIGDDYEVYCKKIPMVLPLKWRSSR